MITLTDEEELALRELFGALAVLEERGFDDSEGPYPYCLVITRQVWREMLRRPREVFARRFGESRMVRS